MFQETSHGVQFRLEEPEFLIEDIAHALSQQARFNGHASDQYSVAEHSVLVSLITEGDPFEGLMHDATEAYIGDLVKPVKNYCSDYEAIEAALWERLAAWAGLKKKLSKATKVADNRMLLLEAERLLPSQGRNFNSYDKFGPHTHDYRPEIKCYSWQLAKALFLNRYYELIADKEVVNG